MEKFKQIILNLVLLFSVVHSSQAELTSDQSAAIDQKPVIDNAPNNVPLVQIAPPNESGVSHNRYDTFNVEPNGTILNNSSNATQTQLGGYVIGNHRFKSGQSAQVILNEVRGSNPSLLQGFLEVAGQHAEVIVANPNGITCSGCGFLNTTRGMLTTGTPIWVSRGNLAGFDVRQGEIIINGTGLNGSEIDRVAFLSDSIRINAGVWAKELDVIAGQNQINHATLDVHSTSSEQRTGVSIDISSLGGMYANKIHLIGTQQGMGVRSAGNIASTGEFTIQSNGQVELTGQTQAQDVIHIQAQEKFSNTGAVTSGGTINIAAYNIQQNGAMVAGVKSDGNLILHADNKIVLTNQNWAANNLTLDANSIDISDANLYAKENMSWIAHDGDITHIRSTTFANSFSLQATRQFLNQENSQLEATLLSMQAASLNNADSTIRHLGSDTFYGIFSGKISNNAGSIVSNGSIYLESTQLENRQGQLTALSGDLSIYVSDAIHTEQGWMSSNHDIYIDAFSLYATSGTFLAHRTMELSIADQAQFDAATLQIGGDLAIDVNHFMTSNAIVTVGGTGFINAGRWDNTDGELWASRWIVNGTSLNNNYGKIFQTGTSDSQFNLISTLNNSFGEIASNAKKLLITTSTLDNTSGKIHHIGDEALEIVTDLFKNQDGQVTSKKDTTLSIGYWQNMGKLIINGDLNFSYHHDIVFDSNLEWNINGDANLSTTGLWTQYGVLNVVGELILKSCDFLNDGEIDANHLLIQAKNNVTNSGVLSGGLVYLTAANLTNRGVVTANKLQIEADYFLSDTDKSVIASTENSYFYIKHNFINQNSAWIYSLGDQFFFKDANGNNMDSFLNSSAKIESEGALIIAANLLVNKKTAFEIGEQLISSTPGHDTWNEPPPCWKDKCEFREWTYTDTITQTYMTGTPSAELLAGGDIMLKSQTLQNNYSIIAAGGNLNLTAHTIDNVSFQAVEQWQRQGTYHRHYYVQMSGQNNNHWSDDYQLINERSTRAIGNLIGVMSSNADFTGDAKNINIQTINAYEQLPDGFSIVTSVDGSKTDAGVEVTTRDGTSKLIFVGDPVGDHYKLPSSMFYQINDDASAKYLVETNPRFTQYKSFLSSDYYFQHLGFDLAVVQKRLGDGFYEQRLIMDQVLTLTGKRYLEGFNSTEDQFSALLDNGVAFSQKFNIRPGMALSAEQMSLLTSDLIWMEEKIVNGQKVLVPVVYLARLKSEDLNSSRATITAKNVNLKATETISNTGSHIHSDQYLSLQGQDIINREGHLNGQLISIAATRDLLNESGLIEGDTVSLAAGRDLTFKTLSQTVLASTLQLDSSTTLFGHLSEVRANNLLIQAGQDISLYGANVSATNDATLIAGRNFLMETVSASSSDSYSQGKNYSNSNNTWHLQSGLTTGQDLNVITGNDVTFRGAYVDVGRDATMISGGNITFDAVRETQSNDRHSSKNSSWMRASNNDDYIIGSQFNADGNVTLAAVGTTSSIQVFGSYLGSDHGAVNLLATNDVTLSTVREKHDSYSENKSKSSSFLSSEVKQQSNQRHESDIIGGAIISVMNDVTVVAGKDIAVTGSMLMAGRDLTMFGESVSISNATEQRNFQDDYIHTQKGLVWGVTHSTIDQVENGVEAAHRSTVVSDSRLQALYDYRAARELKSASDSGTSSGLDGLKVQTGYAESKSHRTSDIETTTAISSKVLAGRDMTIVSTQGDIHIIGSNLSAQNVLLASARDVILQSASNTTNSDYKNRDITTAVGTFASAGTDSVGVGIYGDGNLNRKNEHGDVTSYINTSVTTYDTLAIMSARDTTLVGAQASGQTIIANIGRDLTLISQQDTANFKQKEETANLGGQVTLFGAETSKIHGGYSQSNINSNYKSVQEQSGLYAGNGGFDIYVGSNTNLVGAVIASTAEASKNVVSTETFSHSNLHNQYQTESSNYGVSFKSDDITPSIGVALSDKDTSTTYAAISNGTFEIRSGATSDVSRDTSNANHILENKLSLEHIEEQQELARVFGEDANQFVGDIAQQHGWANGSTEKIVLHTIVGGVQASLGGGDVVAGAAGAGTSEAMYGIVIGSEWTSMAIGAGIGAITGSYQTGAATAQEAYLFNCLAHECLKHYIEGSGKSMEANFSELGADQIKAEDFDIFQQMLTEGLPDGTYQIDMNRGWQTQSLNAKTSYGQVNLHLDGTLTIFQGNYTFDGYLSALPDKYNFDRKKEGEREVWAEWSTSLGSKLPGKPFYNIFTGQRELHSQGLLERKN